MSELSEEERIVLKKFAALWAMVVTTKIGNEQRLRLIELIKGFLNKETNPRTMYLCKKFIKHLEKLTSYP